ncbi:MAG TPA: hypothetical protein VI299_01120 [Polyangiales bacterium]
MGTTVAVMRFAAALSLAVGSCAHAPAPLPERTIVYRREYLGDKPSAISGDLQHVKGGVWCSEDDAFSIPIIPYPDGPVSIGDEYHGWGVTALFDMFDAHESVLEIIRTRIPVDWTEQDMKGHVAQGVQGTAELGGDVMTTELVSQAGRKQLQQLNRMPNYEGRRSAHTLWIMQGVAMVHSPEACRVDRHIVEHGYYFQISAVAFRIAPPYDRCKVAEEMAAWAAQNIQIGKGCGPANPPAPPEH